MGQDAAVVQGRGSKHREAQHPGLDGRRRGCDRPGGQWLGRSTDLRRLRDTQSPAALPREAPQRA